MNLFLFFLFFEGRPISAPYLVPEKHFFSSSCPPYRDMAMFIPRSGSNRERGCSRNLPFLRVFFSPLPLAIPLNLLPPIQRRQPRGKRKGRVGEYLAST
ncbi:hypothetical protein IE53DRAFT_160848 [Violaceomyces palustris]|uniref:Uncharacterized protein n=1 Tax=Violaceomyces palustris TaxID=1673888 RepID=A0ACD0NTM4_9BASI|nr:hypothetical protein IE53DRAFT_160848 [Violaceomyces palustris]